MNALVTQLVLLQVVLPLALLTLHATLVPVSAAGLAFRVVGIAVLLLYLAAAGLWLFPPWWTPWALVLLHALATFRARRLYTARTHAAGRARRTGEAGIGVLATALGLYLLVPALAGRQAPDDTVALASPLEAGRYLVLSGGTSPSINNHLMTLEGERYAPWRGQSHALDLIAIDTLGLRASGISPIDATRYRIHGRRVLAPCAGTVRASADGVPDMPVPEMDRTHMLGNHVLLDCDKFAAVLAHFAPGSVQVAPGDAVRVGDALGRVGNSGNSAEPHLHVHVQRTLPPDAPISGEPLWFTIDGRFLARNNILHVP